MDKRIQEILMKQDSIPGDLKTPFDFKYSDLEKEAVDLKNYIEKRIGKTEFVELERTQDASFTFQLRVMPAGFEFPKPVKLGIILSNFGRLFMLWSSDRENMQKYPLDDIIPRSDIISLLNKRGFTFIPADALKEPYDGRHKDKVPPNFTWLDRFFNHL